MVNILSVIALCFGAVQAATCPKSLPEFLDLNALKRGNQLQVSGSSTVHQDQSVVNLIQEAFKYCCMYISGNEKFWVTYDFASPIYFQSYALRTAEDYWQRDPVSWTVHANQVDPTTGTVEKNNVEVAGEYDDSRRERLQLK